MLCTSCFSGTWGRGTWRGRNPGPALLRMVLAVIRGVCLQTPVLCARSVCAQRFCRGRWQRGAAQARGGGRAGGGRVRAPGSRRVQSAARRAGCRQRRGKTAPPARWACASSGARAGRASGPAAICSQSWLVHRCKLIHSFCKPRHPSALDSAAAAACSAGSAASRPELAPQR